MCPSLVHLANPAGKVGARARRIVSTAGPNSEGQRTLMRRWNREWPYPYRRYIKNLSASHHDCEDASLQGTDSVFRGSESWARWAGQFFVLVRDRANRDSSRAHPHVIFVSASSKQELKELSRSKETNILLVPDESNVFVWEAEIQVRGRAVGVCSED